MPAATAEQIVTNARALEAKGAPEDVIRTYVREAKRELSGDFSLGRMVENIPGSAVDVGKSLITPVLHPVQTAKGLGQMAKGAISKLIPGEQPSETDFDRLTEHFKDRYGSIDNFKRSLENDPVGVAADASAILSVGGLVTRGAGNVARLPGLSRAGEQLSRAGAAIEPVTIAAKGVGAVSRAGGELAAGLGGFTTGTGKNVIKEAFQSGAAEKFTRALRGKVPGEQVFDEAIDSLNVIRTKRSKDYTTRLNRVKQINDEISPKELFNTFQDKLDDFGVKRGGDGALDFRDSTLRLDQEAIKIVNQVGDLFDDFGSRPGHLTPKGFDTLKRTLDNVFTPTSGARAFVQPLRSKVKSMITKAVPEYAEMTRNYQEFSEIIEELEKAFSLKSTASADTAIRKLTNALGKNNEFKKSMLDKMEILSGNEITQQIAGISLAPKFPQRGIVSAFLGAAAVGGPVAFGPKFLALFPLASPRVVGEFARALGIGKNAVDDIIKAVGAQKLATPGVAQVGVQTGRAIEPTLEK